MHNAIIYRKRQEPVGDGTVGRVPPSERQRILRSGGAPVRRRIIEDMAALHITEAELARDIASALVRVQAGAEIVIERDAKPVAVLRAAEPRRRKLSEIAASLSSDSTATLDAGFAADVQAFIDSHREPLNPPEWDQAGGDRS